MGFFLSSDKFQLRCITSSVSLSGWILIDRCGKHFGTVLNYLRDNIVSLPKNRQEIKELMAEAKYYLIQGLVDLCQAALQVREGRPTDGGAPLLKAVEQADAACMESELWFISHWLRT